MKKLHPTGFVVHNYPLWGLAPSVCWWWRQGSGCRRNYLITCGSLHIPRNWFASSGEKRHLCMVCGAFLLFSAHRSAALPAAMRCCLLGACSIQPALQDAALSYGCADWCVPGPLPSYSPGRCVRGPYLPSLTSSKSRTHWKGLSVMVENPKSQATLENPIKFSLLRK